MRHEQSASAVVLVRPHRFRSNPETRLDNAFQLASEPDGPETAGRAYAEVTAMVAQLQGAGVRVHLFEDQAEGTPDSVFPNNWFSTHGTGEIVLYPMAVGNRRQERRPDVIMELRRAYQVNSIVDYSVLEDAAEYLEGTGAMVLDRPNRVAYACRSNRMSERALDVFCDDFRMEPVVLSAVDRHGAPIYHTNVMMAVCDGFALVCLEAITDADERESVRARLADTGHVVIEITLEQVERFAGNVLQVRGSGGPVLVLSTTAAAALRPEQRATIERFTETLAVDIPTIESAGGSARCMIAEVHLKPKSAPGAGGASPWRAQRVATYQPSKVREVFAKASAPGMISLAGGAPNLRELPWGDLADAASRLLVEQGPVALQYSFGVGTPDLRSAITEVMAEEGLSVAADDVIVTAGSQLALEALCKVTVNPGDVVITEGPCYSGGLSAIMSYQADVRHARTDADGVRPEHVAELIARAHDDGKRVAFVYCIPTFQNPGGTVLTGERRDELVAVCADAGVLLVEDNAYGLLGFDGRTMPSLRERNPEGVAYLGSFSKMFAPGLRLGWVVAPADLKRPLIDTVETMILNPPTFNQLLVTDYLRSVDWRGRLATMRDLYRRRGDALLAALEATMPEGVTWTRPTGGFYVWLTLPEELDANVLMDRAMERGVVFVPGTAFYSDGQGRHACRLSYSLPAEEDLDRGGRILGELFTEALAEARGAGA